MLTVGEIQMSGMLTMVMLALILVLRVPARAMRHPGFPAARWLMVGGTLLIALQFLVQHQMGLRQMGVTQAVLVNLLLFMPAALLIGMAVLYVQRQGRVHFWEWAVELGICLLSTIVLLVAVFSDGVALPYNSPLLREAEYIGAALYAVMQSVLFFLQFREYRRLQKAVDEYFDRARNDLLNWMGLSVTLLALLGLLVPFIIFFEGLPLVLFSVVFFIAIFYCVISLYSYGISEDAGRVEEAEGQDDLQDVPETSVLQETPASPESSEPPAPNTVAAAARPLVACNQRDARNASLFTLHSSLSDEERQRVEQALEQWKDAGGYRQHNLTVAIVAREMHLSSRQLQTWLRQSEYQKLATLMNRLRVEDAQRVLREHPDWSAESVADYCGFSSRQYFHQVFVQYTGTTPAQYQKIK